MCPALSLIVCEELFLPTPSRIFDLLEEALTTERLPEELCADCPELLEELRRRIELCTSLNNQIDDLFPSSTPSPACDEPTVIPRIDGYLITNVLGRGGAGIVYRAQQVSLDRDVAIKMLLTGRYSTKSELHRLSREARAIGRLRHPNIVQVYDVGTVGGQPYFTMELVENGTLAKHLGGRPVEAATAAALTVTLAEAIDAAHGVGIVHRDLKPANILMAIDGSPKIADFGLARHFGEDSAMLTLSAHVGTPSYMAPEQVRGTRDATNPLVDIYALGAILYECLTGRPPFRGETSPQTQQQVLTLDPTPPSKLNPQVPRDLETICLKCLSKSGLHRYASAAALAADVRRFLNDEPILARPTGRFERLFKWTKRHPAWATAVAASLAMVICGSIGLMRMRALHHDRQRAIEADLRDVAAYEGHGEWSKAREVLHRDLAPADSLLSNELAEQLHLAERNLDLIAALDAIHLERVTDGDLAIYRMKADNNYRKVFKNCLSIEIGDVIDAAAVTINQSPVRTFLAVAIDDWAISTTAAKDRNWLLELGKRVQPGDHDEWGDRIRDADHWPSVSELKDLSLHVPVDRVPTSALLILADRLSTSSVSSSTAFLRRVQQANPSDFWVNLQLGTDELWQFATAAEAFSRAALAIRPDAAVGYTVLGDALHAENHPYDAISAYQKALELDPTSARTRNNCGNALVDIGRFAEGLAFHDQALTNDPQYAWADFDAAEALMRMHRFNDAIPRYQKAIDSGQCDAWAERNWRLALLLSGRVDEAMKPWRGAMDPGPWKIEIAADYAGLCAYLQRDADYEASRKDLLQLAGSVNNATNLQAIAFACLLKPAPDDTLKRLAALLQKHPVSKAATPGSDYYRYRFNKALLAYRQRRPEDTIMLLGAADHEALGPASELVLAMAQFDAGQPQQAKKTFADVVVRYDWRPSSVCSTDVGKYHVLRHEAESKLMPNLSELLRSQEVPSDKLDRIAILGACIEDGMNAFAARLYAQAFEEDASLYRQAGQAIRFQAACAAVASGDAQLRARAQRWLTDDLAFKLANLPTRPALASRARARLENELGRWQTDPDLAIVRDADALQHLPLEERQLWQELWHDVSAAMDGLDGSR
jgi:eukaryotic-like serine/threonine-protein kinase